MLQEVFQGCVSEFYRPIFPNVIFNVENRFVSEMSVFSSVIEIFSRLDAVILSVERDDSMLTSFCAVAAFPYMLHPRDVGLPRRRRSCHQNYRNSSDLRQKSKTYSKHREEPVSED